MGIINGGWQTAPHIPALDVGRLRQEHSRSLAETPSKPVRNNPRAKDRKQSQHDTYSLSDRETPTKHHRSYYGHCNDAKPQRDFAKYDILDPLHGLHHRRIATCVEQACWSAICTSCHSAIYHSGFTNAPA